MEKHIKKFISLLLVFTISYGSIHFEYTFLNQSASAAKINSNLENIPENPDDDLYTATITTGLSNIKTEITFIDDTVIETISSEDGKILLQLPLGMQSVQVSGFNHAFSGVVTADNLAVLEISQTINAQDVIFEYNQTTNYDLFRHNMDTIIKPTYKIDETMPNTINATLKGYSLKWQRRTAGEVTIIAQTTGDTYQKVSASFKIIVNKGRQDITTNDIYVIESDNITTYSLENHAENAIGDVTYSVLKTDDIYATISDTTLTWITGKSGNAQIMALANETLNFNETSSIFNLNIGKYSQNISAISQNIIKTANDETEYDLYSNISDAKTTLNFSIRTQGGLNASIKDNILTWQDDKAGTIIIDAYAINDKNYNTSNAISFSITVLKGDGPIEIGDLNLSANDETEYDLSNHILGLAGEITYTVLDAGRINARLRGESIIKFDDNRAGVAIINVKSSGDINFNPSDATFNLNVAKGNQIITTSDIYVKADDTKSFDLIGHATSNISTRFTYFIQDAGNVQAEILSGIGKATLTWKENKSGIAKIKIIADGNLDYNENISYITLNVAKHQQFPIASDIYKKSADTLQELNLENHVKNSFGDVIYVIKDSGTLNAEINQNIISWLATGSSIITAQVSGDENFNPVNIDFSIIVQDKANASTELKTLLETLVIEKYEYNGTNQGPQTTQNTVSVTYQTQQIPAGPLVDITEDATFQSFYLGTGSTIYNKSQTKPQNAGTYDYIIEIPQNDPVFIGSAKISFIIEKTSQISAITAIDITSIPSTDTDLPIIQIGNIIGGDGDGAYQIAISESSNPETLVWQDFSQDFRFENLFSLREYSIFAKKLSDINYKESNITLVANEMTDKYDISKLNITIELSTPKVREELIPIFKKDGEIIESIPNSGTIKYQWLVDGVENASTATYIPTFSDALKEIQLVISSSNYNGTLSSNRSVPTLANIPEKISNPSVEEGDRQIIIQWDSVIDNGGDILGSGDDNAKYIIDVKLSPRNTVTNAFEPEVYKIIDDTNFHIENGKMRLILGDILGQELTNGAEYQIFIYAQNSIGLSIASNIIYAIPASSKKAVIEILTPRNLDDTMDNTLGSSIFVQADRYNSIPKETNTFSIAQGNYITIIAKPSGKILDEKGNILREAQRFVKWVKFSETDLEEISNFSLNQGEIGEELFQNPLTFKAEKGVSYIPYYTSVSTQNNDQNQIFDIQVSQAQNRKIIPLGNSFEISEINRKFRPEILQYDMYLTSGDTKVIDFAVQSWDFEDNISISYKGNTTELTRIDEDYFEIYKLNVIDTAPIFFNLENYLGETTQYVINLNIEETSASDPHIIGNVRAYAGADTAELLITTQNVKFSSANIIFEIEKNNGIIDGFSNKHGEVFKDETINLANDINNFISIHPLFEISKMSSNGDFVEILIETKTKLPLVINSPISLASIGLKQTAGSSASIDDITKVINAGKRAITDEINGYTSMLDYKYIDLIDTDTYKIDQDTFAYVSKSITSDLYMAVNNHAGFERISFQLYTNDGKDKRLITTKAPFVNGIDLEYELYSGSYELRVLADGYLTYSTTFTVLNNNDVSLNPINLLSGDLNKDGVIDITDKVMLLEVINTLAKDNGASEKNDAIFADYNDDGIINSMDLGMLIENINKSYK